MDIKKMRGFKSNTSGLLSLEASISLTIFIFLMLFLYSYFVIFEARNEIGHVVLSTADSLALDAFANDAADDDSLQGIFYQLYGMTQDTNGVYTNTEKWYENDARDKEEGKKLLAEQVKREVRNRFIAYMGGGDVNKADEKLKSLHVVNGLTGLDFSNCTVSGSDLIVDVRYEIDYEFKVFGLNKLKFSQSCCSKLWK